MECGQATRTHPPEIDLLNEEEEEFYFQTESFQMSIFGFDTAFSNVERCDKKFKLGPEHGRDNERVVSESTCASVSRRKRGR